MKLYIATTTLNFDAIVSTESISPASFYQLRKFGISLFYDKASFMRPNSILLLDVFPYFSISREEVAHCPMVIEIEDSNYPGMFNKVKDNNEYSVYQTGQTIYLSPLSCVIYFYSESDKRATLSKAESIVESKFYLYDALGAIKVFDSRSGFVKLGPDSFKQIHDFAVPESSSIKEDIIINKAKGFIVSYMIGASLSITKESSRLQRLIKDIKNGIYSMGTNDLKSASSKEAIFTLAQEANAISKDLDLNKAKADSRVIDYLDSVQAGNMLKGSSNEDIVSFLKIIDIYKYLFDRVNPRYGEFDIYSLVSLAISAKDDEAQEDVFNRLQSYVDSITKRVGIKQALSDLFILGIDRNVIECKDASLDDDSRRKVEIMFNLFSGYGYRTNDIRTNRIDYIYDAGSAFFPEKTAENQVERDYINAMLDNLEHASSFDIHSTPSEALMALAAFMRTADSDIDKMVSFLVSNEINDPRIAFGLWGLFYGYSNIPQVYFNAFVSSLNKEDKVSFVTQLYRALFSKDPASVVNEDAIVSTSAVKGRKRNVINKVAEYMGLSSPEQEEHSELEKVTEKEDIEDLPPAVIPSGDMPTSRKEEVNHDFDKSGEFSAQGNSFSPTSIVEEPTSKGQPLEGHPYTELWDKVLQIIEEETPSRKEILEYKRTYPAEVDKVFENNYTLIAILNGIESIPASYASSAWKKAKGKIRKLIKQKEDDEYSVFRMANPTVIESLQCTKNLSPVVIKRLNDCWDYTGKQETDLKEHIRFFLSLSKKEGRGDLTYSHTLKDVFVGRLAEQVEKELYQYFGIKG